MELRLNAHAAFHQCPALPPYRWCAWRGSVPWVTGHIWARIRRGINNAALWDLSVRKVGAVFVGSKLRPHMDYPVQPQWVWTALESGKVTSEMARAEFLRMPGSVARTLETLSRWRVELRQDGAAEYRQWRRLHSNVARRPWRQYRLSKRGWSSTAACAKIALFAKGALGLKRFHLAVHEFIISTKLPRSRSGQGDVAMKTSATSCYSYSSCIWAKSSSGAPMCGSSASAAYLLNAERLWANSFVLDLADPMWATEAPESDLPLTEPRVCGEPIIPSRCRAIRPRSGVPGASRPGRSRFFRAVAAPLDIIPHRGGGGNARIASRVYCIGMRVLDAAGGFFRGDRVPPTPRGSLLSGAHF